MMIYRERGMAISSSGVLHYQVATVVWSKILESL